MGNQEAKASDHSLLADRHLEKIPVGEGSLLCHELDGDLVMYQYANDLVHHLNPTANLIWECLDTTNTREDILTRIASSYKLPEDEIRDDVDGLLIALVKQGLIKSTELRTSRQKVDLTTGSDADAITHSRRAFMQTGWKSVAMLAYAVPVIETLMVGDAEAQAPSVITNDPPPPTADPVITSISPTSGAQNKKLTVSIYGYDFMSGFTSDFGSGISVTKNTYKTPNWVQAKITIAKKASKGTRIVTVTNPNTEFDTYCCFTVT